MAAEMVAARRVRVAVERVLEVTDPATAAAVTAVGVRVVAVMVVAVTAAAVEARAVAAEMVVARVAATVVREVEWAVAARRRRWECGRLWGW